jgi:hypothetical protein
VTLATTDGSGYWFTTSGSSGTTGYTLGYVQHGANAAWPNVDIVTYPGTDATTGKFSVALLNKVGAKFMDFAADGSLVASAQNFAVVSGIPLATDLHTTVGTPTSAASWVPMGLTGLTAPRGFVFAGSDDLWVCNYDVGVAFFSRASGVWAAGPTYAPSATEKRVMQAAIGLDGATLYVTTPSAVYALGMASRTWLNSGAPIAVAAANTEFRGIALAPGLARSPSPSPAPYRGPFLSSNMLVSRIGDGSASLGLQASPVASRVRAARRGWSKPSGPRGLRCSRVW